MKYLLIVQGEGRGHLTQAIALSELLRKENHTVVEVLVGRCKGREIPSFFFDRIGAPVVGFDSPSIDYGKKGRKAHILCSVLKNLTPRSMLRWRKSVVLIGKRVEETQPDVVVNFYDMMAGLAGWFGRIKPPMVAVAHQFLVDHPAYPHRKALSHLLGSLRLTNWICALGAVKKMALSFYPLPYGVRESIVVVPPLLRAELFELQVEHDDFFLGYMLNPAYFEQVDAWHQNNPEQELHLFWDKKDAPPVEQVRPNLTMHRLDDQKFLALMARCRGYVTTAGFESVCEALYLGKPIQMIPAHLEQQINAFDAVDFGAGVEAYSFDLDPLLACVARYAAPTESFRAWVDGAGSVFLIELSKVK